MYKMYDYYCYSCEYTWEELTSTTTEEAIICPKCGGVDITKVLGGNLAICNDPKVRAEVLKKRSEDHSRKTRKDDVERVRAKQDKIYKKIGLK
jgi:putative FmdB family regulatory protein